MSIAVRAAMGLHDRHPAQCRSIDFPLTDYSSDAAHFVECMFVIKQAKARQVENHLCRQTSHQIRTIDPGWTPPHCIISFKSTPGLLPYSRRIGTWY
jgi:hypothetical protein